MHSTEALHIHYVPAIGADPALDNFVPGCGGCKLPIAAGDPIVVSEEQEDAGTVYCSHSCHESSAWCGGIHYSQRADQRALQARCMCPDDCNCRNAHRTTYCGCTRCV